MLRPLTAASPRTLRGTALVRIDVNAADNWRLEAVIPTITYLAEHAKKVIVMSHKGRPTPGKPLGKLSLASDAQQLADRIDAEVWFISDTSIPAVRQSLKQIPDGSVVVLENIRAFRGEETSSLSFAQSLASLGDYYVSDAFPVLHHGAASVSVLPTLLPSYAGFQLVTELEKLGTLTERVRHPYVVVIGGAKAHDKLGVLQQCIDKADIILVGGACANALLMLSGVKVGSSIYERDPKLLAALKPFVGNKKIVLPTDFVKSGGKILDIGPRTTKIFTKHLSQATTILWTGPLGLIEQKRFSHGSLAVARAIGRNKKAFSVTGGGETVTFLKQHGLDRGFSFISTGGGALIDFVSGRSLIGVQALSGKTAPAKKPALAQQIKKVLAAPVRPPLAPVYDLFFHNDFDGYSSAAVFLDFFKQYKVKVGRYVPVEYNARFDDLWHHKDGLARYANQKTINPAVLVDFRYHPQAAFWYDHHATPFSRQDWEDAFQPDAAHIVDASYASGCHLVYDALMQHFGYVPSKHIKELVRWADIIDGAKYTDAYQTIALRDAAIRINTFLGPAVREIWTEDDRPQPLPWLVELFATKPLSVIAKDKRLLPLLTRIEGEIKASVSYYRRHSVIHGVVVVTDESELTTPRLRFAPYYVAPQAVFAIRPCVLPDGTYKVSVAVSPWKRERNSFNIGAMMTNFGGGGHQMVGSAPAKTRADADRIVEYFVAAFNGA